MRLLSRILGGLVGLIVLLAAVALVYVFVTTRPRLQGETTLRGLRGDVTVSRDRWGVPHIRARESDADAVFALGYVHAQDRLWQMEFQRRIGAGRLSEVLGPAALDQDRFLRTWGFYRAARSALPALNARSRELLAAYAAGVNAAMREGRLPLEFRVLRYTPEPWTETDTLVWAKMMAFDLGGNWQEELGGQNVVEKLGPQALRELYPDYPKGAPTILSDLDLRRGEGVRAPGGAVALSDVTREALRAQARVADSLGFEWSPDKGSNDWVVSGRFTRSGKPLLADDPHLKLQAPMLWYLADIQGPTLHAVGGTIPGLPAVVIGRNDRIAWGVTNTNPDVQDLFVLPEDAPVTRRTEVIKVKGQPDVRLDVQESRFGPVITGVGGVTRERVALRWTALDPGDTTLDAYIGLNYARDWQDFRTALRSYVAPMQNFVYADVDGNIGYTAPGRVPIRASGDGRLPAPADDAHAWKGSIPFEDLPWTYNPPEGVIVTANNKVVPDGYPYFLGNEGNWAAPYRAQRILQLVRDRQGLTATDMERVQNDVQSLLWQDMRPALLSTKPAGEREREALERLRAWDGRQTRDSVASTVFAAWYARLAQMANDELGQEGYWGQPLFVANQIRENGGFCADEKAGVRGCADLRARTLSAAVNDLAGLLGEDVSNWRWERAHRTESNHGALGGVKAVSWIWNRSIGSPGGTYTVNPGSFRLSDFRQTNGASYRQVVDLADMNASRFVGTLGQSGNPLSVNYADQQALWRDGQSLRMSTDEKDWGEVRVLRLRPQR
ncbi:penicillin acylase family protein [Deinococcus pimensis]|uniref:penicillin acylase family protein n=1 Tax=Deinococcus pimensis TaxID=309888 RepID=UPI000486DD69|nr:penicillin acylase family protein [Deinococcus pimensis]